MPEPSTLALFSLAALALIAVPGPAVLYVVSRGIDQGRRAALVSALGIEGGGQRVLVNGLNPKTALFFLAFLPQFVDLAAGTLGPRLKAGVRRRVQRWGSGSVFVALGIGTALSTTRRSV